MIQFIDHTLLKPNATASEIHQLCKEAILNNFASVCIHPHFITLAFNDLKFSKVSICTVIGFPLGSNTTETKAFEVQDAIYKGADECDMVINISWVKDKRYDLIEEEIGTLKALLKDKVLKVIIEISLLTDTEIIKLSEIVSKSGADFIKTSTGFGAHGATFEAVKLIRENISDHIQIKASGGIRDYDTAKKYIDLGVTRLGTSSGIEIINGLKSSKSY